MNIKWTLAGHTDTKQLNNGSYEIVALKTYMAIFNDINVILCIGENLKDREAGKTSEVTARQLEAVSKKINESQWGNIVIAYEPVWAIETGAEVTP